jgi:hypothetical protein
MLWDRAKMGQTIAVRALAFRCRSGSGWHVISALESVVVRGGWHVISALESVVVGIVEEEGLYVGS